MCMPTLTELALLRVQPVMKMFDDGMLSVADTTSRKHALSCVLTSGMPPGPKKVTVSPRKYGQVDRGGGLAGGGPGGFGGGGAGGCGGAGGEGGGEGDGGVGEGGGDGDGGGGEGEGLGGGLGGEMGGTGGTGGGGLGGHAFPLTWYCT